MHMHCFLALVLFPAVVSAICDHLGGEVKDKPRLLRYKWAAMPSTFVGGALGVCLSLLLGRRMRPDGDFFLVFRTFAGGAIVSTAFVSVLSHAYELLDSPCLPEVPWQEFPFSTIIAMFAALAVILERAFMKHFWRLPAPRNEVTEETGPRNEETAPRNEEKEAPRNEETAPVEVEAPTAIVVEAPTAAEVEAPTAVEVEEQTLRPLVIPFVIMQILMGYLFSMMGAITTFMANAYDIAAYFFSSEEEEEDQTCNDGEREIQELQDEEEEEEEEEYQSCYDGEREIQELEDDWKVETQTREDKNEEIQEREDEGRRNHHVTTQVIIELGMIVHSMIVGVELGAAKTPETVRPLIAAMTFHQLFQGIALGFSINQARFTTWIVALMAIIFAIATPSGIGIGIAITDTYNTVRPATVIPRGTLSAASAGILTSVGFVDYLSAFKSPQLQRNRRLRLAAYVSFLVSACLVGGTTIVIDT